MSVSALSFEEASPLTLYVLEDDDIAPTIVELLKKNSTLSVLDLRENKSLKSKTGGCY